MQWTADANPETTVRRGAGAQGTSEGDWVPVGTNVKIVQPLVRILIATSNNTVNSTRAHNTRAKRTSCIALRTCLPRNHISLLGLGMVEKGVAVALLPANDPPSQYRK